MPSYPKDFAPRIEIEDQEMKEMAKQVLGELKLGILKGVANEIDKTVYPLTADDDSIEKATIKYLRSRKPEKQNETKTTVKAILDQPALLRENLFGAVARVDLKSNKTVALQVKELKLDSRIKLRPNYLNRLEIKGNRLIKKIEREPANSHLLRPIYEDLVIRPRPLFELDPINRKYSEKSGVLGNAVGGRGTCPDGKGRYQHYQHGSIYWSPDTGAHEVHGAIHEKWKSLGWETSFLGYPITDELTTPDGEGRFTHFQGGSIYWTPSTGAHEVHGAIRAKWSAMGWETSYLGYPITDERTTPDTVGRYNHFQGGSIYWTPSTGAQAVHENIRNKWEEKHWELGYLGYPVIDTVIYPGETKMVGRFQGGEIVWHATSGATDTMPASKLRFRIHRVKCLDETNPEWPGDDEIDMGGVACSVNNGATTKIPAYRVSSSFDDGEQVVYNPPREFFTFNLKDIPGWPKHFTMTMALAEIDSGGFNDFLNKLLQYIRDKVVSLIAEKTGALVGAALGTLIGSLGGIAGAIVGALVGWLVGELFDWLISLFGDDKFLPWTAELMLPSVWHKWGAYSDSPEWSFWTKAHGGKYEVWFDWQLLA
jgi:hypothetical protein